MQVIEAGHARKAGRFCGPSEGTGGGRGGHKVARGRAVGSLLDKKAPSPTSPSPPELILGTKRPQFPLLFHHQHQHQLLHSWCTTPPPGRPELLSTRA